MSFLRRARPEKLCEGSLVRRLAWIPLSVALAGCGAEEAIDPADTSCYAPGEPSGHDLCALLDGACVDGLTAPAHSEAVTVVPDADAMPAGVVSQKAHNNLDIAFHAGRLFFAFRTAPSHFASPDVVMYVVSTTDQKRWTLEASFALGKDLREPRFLTLGDKLFLYMARLGEVTLTFKPEAMLISEQRGGCRWTEPEEIAPTGEPGFIPWRAREIDGVGHLIGYVGGEDIYELADGGTRVYWLETHDGRHFEPVGDEAMVIGGGVSETDIAIMDDGGIVAVSRNEAGDEEGFGSKVCRAQAGALSDWSCATDKRKYDSPLVFRHGDEVYLIARRQLANDGLYDLDMDELSHEEQTLAYQSEYWNTAKRCAVWKVDRDALSVSHVLDLPSAGDTCFASQIDLPNGQHLVYNYTSPLDDLDVAWNDGQFGETFIYRTTLEL